MQMKISASAIPSPGLGWRPNPAQSCPPSHEREALNVPALPATDQVMLKSGEAASEPFTGGAAAATRAARERAPVHTAVGR